MAIVNPGDKLPAAYLERFDPAENVVYRFSVLSTSALAVEFHWVDVPSKNIKGTHQCLQGICCQALGRRSQTYNVPIYVYRQAGSTEGDIYVWQMTPARWKKFSDLALQVDLLQYDLTFSAQKRGQGMDWSYSILPDAKYRDYWSLEQREQLKIATQSFYQLGEASLITPMSHNDWVQLLYDMGYDVQNQCWPGGQSPMNSGASFGAIRGAVGAGSMLPPPPPAGYVPSPQGHPNIASGVVLQPTQLQGIPVHTVPVSPISHEPPAGHVPYDPPMEQPKPSTSVSVASSVPNQNIGVGTPIVSPNPNQNSVQPKLQEITSEELNVLLS